MYIMYEYERDSVFRWIKNLAYDSAFIEPNTDILPSWNKPASRFLTKIAHCKGVCVCFLQTLKSQSLIRNFYFFIFIFLTLFSLVGISVPVQRKHLKAKNNFLVSESLESARPSEGDERGMPKV